MIIKAFKDGGVFQGYVKKFSYKDGSLELCDNVDDAKKFSSQAQVEGAIDFLTGITNGEVGFLFES